MQRRPGAPLLSVFGNTMSVLLMSDIGKDKCEQIRCMSIIGHAARIQHM